MATHENMGRRVVTLAGLGPLAGAEHVAAGAKPGEHDRRSMSLSDGDRVPQSQLPDPLRLCVGAHESATFAVHAWDNDDSEARFKDAYDESDNLLLGTQRRLRGDPPHRGTDGDRPRPDRPLPDQPNRERPLARMRDRQRRPPGAGREHGHDSARLPRGCRRAAAPRAGNRAAATRRLLSGVRHRGDDCQALLIVGA
jgi:hypothetical protein